MDINPLILTEDGPVAVDAVCFKRSASLATS